MYKTHSDDERDIAADDTLVEQAMRRRADGFRSLRARRAWRRLVRACAAGELPAQDAVRERAAELTGADVRDLLAAAPGEPADRAAYLTLIGQADQRRSLDPDGSLLALAYGAAAPEVRQRLRALLTAEGDSEVIRVVVTGEQRDRIAEMSPEELDYLGHQLAEHHRWDELRRLARDLPLAGAATIARLVPPAERAQGRPLAGISRLAEHHAGRLAALVDRLPRERLITHPALGSPMYASFSPDSSELAVRMEGRRRGERKPYTVETLRTSTGQATRLFEENGRSWSGSEESIVHLGDEVIVRRWERLDRYFLVRVLPDHRVLCAPSDISDVRRSSRGAVVLHPGGPSYASPGATRLRNESFHRFNAALDGRRILVGSAHCSLTTLPEAGLFAFVCRSELHVMREVDFGDPAVSFTARLTDERMSDGFCPAVSFLSPRLLAVNVCLMEGDEDSQYTELWEILPEEGRLRRTEAHEGEMLDRWPLEWWRGKHVDASFAARVFSSDSETMPGRVRDIDPQLPLLQGPPAGPYGFTAQRAFLALAPWGDTLATSTDMHGYDDMGACELHSPHLPSARELLERPLLHCGPRDLREVRELRARIGDPAVRDALDLLAACLTDRFGADIALGDTAPVPPQGPHDIALGDGPQ